MLHPQVFRLRSGLRSGLPAQNSMHKKNGRSVWLCDHLLLFCLAMVIRSVRRKRNVGKYEITDCNYTAGLRARPPPDYYGEVCHPLICVLSYFSHNLTLSVYIRKKHTPKNNILWTQDMSYYQQDNSLVVNSSYLEFTRCCSSEYFFLIFY